MGKRVNRGRGFRHTLGQGRSCGSLMATSMCSSPNDTHMPALPFLSLPSLPHIALQQMRMNATDQNRTHVACCLQSKGCQPMQLSLPHSLASPPFPCPAPSLLRLALQEMLLTVAERMRELGSKDLVLLLQSVVRYYVGQLPPSAAGAPRKLPSRCGVGEAAG